MPSCIRIAEQRITWARVVGGSGRSGAWSGGRRMVDGARALLAAPCSLSSSLDSVAAGPDLRRSDDFTGLGRSAGAVPRVRDAGRLLGLGRVARAGRPPARGSRAAGPCRLSILRPPHRSLSPDLLFLPPSPQPRADARRQSPPPSSSNSLGPASAVWTQMAPGHMPHRAAAPYREVAPGSWAH